MPSKEQILATRVIQQTALLKTLETVEKFVKDFNAERDSCQVQVRIDTLDRVNRSFLAVQDEVESADTAQNLEKHLDERVDFEQRYCVAKGFLLARQTVVPSQSPNVSILPPQQVSSAFHLRLPQIDLPRFDGDFSRWMSFRDTFTSMVHANADIPTVAKLQYLLQSLEKDAKKPFESVDIEADNYATTWDALLKRYDNRRFLKRQLFRALYELPAVKQESANHIRSLVDDFHRHVKALEKLGDPVEHWDTPLVNMLSYKLDHTTLRAWEEKTSSQDDVVYEDMVDFLYQRIRVLNSVGPDLQQPPSTKVAGSFQRSSKPKFAANAATSSSSASSCPLGCSDSHILRNCPEFLGKDVRQRRELVSQKRLCWNCLTFGHPAKKCLSQYNCRTCHDRHHSLLHDSNSTPMTSIPAVSSIPLVQQPLPSTLQGVDSSSSSSSPPRVSMAVQTACNTVLLETVVLHIVDDHGQKFKARALLDSASTSHFISSQLAKQLSNPRSEVDVSVAGIGLSTQQVTSALTATIESRTQPFSTKLEFLVLKQPLAELPATSIDTSAWKFSDFKLADPQFNVPGQIDLIIGGETFWNLHSGRKMLLGQDLPWVVETSFGWAVSGPASTQATRIQPICHLSTTNGLEVLQKIREVDTIPIAHVHPSEEIRCEVLDTATTERNPSGSCIERLTSVENQEFVEGDSRVLAEHRFANLEQRLQQNPAIEETKSRFTNECFQLGPTRRLKEPVVNTKSHIPQRAVIEDSSERNSSIRQRPREPPNRWKFASAFTETLTRFRWCHSPDWLALPPESWPKHIPYVEEASTVSEEGRNVVLSPTISNQADFCQDFLRRRYEHATLHRGTAVCQRYPRHLEERSDQRRFDPERYAKRTTTITIEHTTEPQAVAAVQRTEGTPCQQAYFIDCDGILRVGGRLRNAEPSDKARNPLVLSAELLHTSLLASHVLPKLLHAGSQNLLATLRQNFPFLGGGIKSVFRHCHTCYRSKPALVQQSVADLPASRVASTRPFAVYGTTYCGTHPWPDRGRLHLRCEGDAFRASGRHHHFGVPGCDAPPEFAQQSDRRVILGNYSKLQGQRVRAQSIQFSSRSPLPGVSSDPEVRNSRRLQVVSEETPKELFGNRPSNRKLNQSVDIAVVIEEDEVPPTIWPAGRIPLLHLEVPGNVRVAPLRTASVTKFFSPVPRIALSPSSCTASGSR